MSIDFISPVVAGNDANYLDGVNQVVASGFETCWGCMGKIAFSEVILEWKFGGLILHRHLVCPKDVN